MSDIATLLNEAARFERLAAGIMDDAFIEVLLAMAAESDKEVGDLRLASRLL